jgi:hypothetical protein
MMNLKWGVGFSLIHITADMVRSIRQNTNMSGLISLILTDTNEVTRKIEYKRLWIQTQSRGLSPEFIKDECSCFKKRRNISRAVKVAMNTK